MSEQHPSLPDCAKIQCYLAGFEVDAKWRAERDSYLSGNLLRFRETLAFLPQGQPGGRLLELGASPYLFTLLLKRYTTYDIEVAGEDLPDRGAHLSVLKRSPDTGEEHVFQATNFNVELDRFPYQNDAFDVVLCCELIEHLALDPTHMLMEIHRVLKPGGQLLITTPNVLVLRHVNALLRKRQNIFGPYSGYGIYGRHNREWTLDELVELITGCGFRIEQAEIRDTYPHRGYSRWLKRIFPHFRDVVFVLAQAEGLPVAYYPDSLYVADYARSLRKERL